MTTCLMRSSLRHWVRAAVMASVIAALRALSALGRLSVMRPAAPSRRITASSVISFSLVAVQHVARDDDAHDLIGAFENLMHPEIAHCLFDPEILEIAIAAMDLQRFIGDAKARVG